MIAALVPAHAGARNGSYRDDPLQGFSSDNVEWIGNLPIATPLASTVVDDYLYVTNGSYFYIFDVSEPATPREVGELELGESPEGPWNHISSDGRITVFSHHASTHDPPSPNSEAIYPWETVTRVIDVSDKDDPRVAGSVRTVHEASWTCILDCRWAYGAHGQILDLRDPEQPKLLHRRWDTGLRRDKSLAWTTAYHVSEVRDGLVLTGTHPMYLLDARANPARPRVLGLSDGSPYSIGGVAWPQRGRSRYALSFTILGSPLPLCDAVRHHSTFETAFATWDTTPWRQGNRLIHPVDTYRLSNGRYQNGDPPVSPQPGGCSAWWMDAHPEYGTTGLVGLSAAGHGTKFLRIDEAGTIHEVGWFLGHAASAWQGHWVDDEFFYSMDYNRGIDILRFDRESQ